MAYERNDFGWTYDVEGLVVEDGEFVTVTADGAEHDLFSPVVPLLQRIRKALSIDIVFVAHMIGGVPYVRRAHGGNQRKAIVAERADVMESEVGKGTLGGRGGRPPYLCLPVVSKDGHEFGTVCCRLQPQRSDLGAGSEEEALYSVARLVAMALAVRDPSLPVNVWESSAAAPLGLEEAVH
jgi:hypothetical protein